MGIFRFLFRPPKTTLFRCTHCGYDLELLPKQIRRLEKLYADDPVCPAKAECDICHIGFMIPWYYVDKKGTIYRYHQIKPKIQNLDPNTVMERIYGDPHDNGTIYFGPDT